MTEHTPQIAPQIAIADRLADDDAKLIFDGLKRYNRQQTERPYDRRDLIVTAKDESGTLLGGLVGYTNWDWLYVDLLWADDGQRHAGLGSRLMRAAEEEAVRRGCRWSRLYTYDFQAPGFYRKLGYEVWAELEGYPPGHTQIWLRKALV